MSISIYYVRESGNGEHYKLARSYEDSSRLTLMKATSDAIRHAVSGKTRSSLVIADGRKQLLRIWCSDNHGWLVSDNGRPKENTVSAKKIYRQSILVLETLLKEEKEKGKDDN